MFVLHEPTRGIDVQTKMDIYVLLRELANAGAILVLVTCWNSSACPTDLRHV